jgi:hypothetical protein
MQAGSRLAAQALLRFSRVPAKTASRHRARELRAPTGFPCSLRRALLRAQPLRPPPAPPWRQAPGSVLARRRANLRANLRPHRFHRLKRTSRGVPLASPPTQIRLLRQRRTRPAQPPRQAPRCYCLEICWRAQASQLRLRSRPRRTRRLRPKPLPLPQTPRALRKLCAILPLQRRNLPWPLMRIRRTCKRRSIFPHRFCFRSRRTSPYPRSRRRLRSQAFRFPRPSRRLSIFRRLPRVRRPLKNSLRFHVQVPSRISRQIRCPAPRTQRKLRPPRRSRCSAPARALPSPRWCSMTPALPMPLALPKSTRLRFSLRTRPRSAWSPRRLRRTRPGSMRTGTPLRPRPGLKRTQTSPIPFSRSRRRAPASKRIRWSRRTHPRPVHRSAARMSNALRSRCARRTTPARPRPARPPHWLLLFRRLPRRLRLQPLRTMVQPRTRCSLRLCPRRRPHHRPRASLSLRSMRAPPPTRLPRMRLPGPTPTRTASKLDSKIPLSDGSASAPILPPARCMLPWFPAPRRRPRPSAARWRGCTRI